MSNKEQPFQPTLPARGETSVCASCCVPACNFNPRSPHGERLFAPLKRVKALCISTHAPRTGSDDRHRLQRGRDRHISTHAPRTGSDMVLA